MSAPLKLVSHFILWVISGMNIPDCGASLCLRDFSLHTLQKQFLQPGVPAPSTKSGTANVE